MKPLFLQTSRYHDIKQPLSLSEGAHTQRYSHSSLYRFNLHLLVLMSSPYDTVWLGHFCQLHHRLAAQDLGPAMPFSDLRNPQSSTPDVQEGKEQSRKKSPGLCCGLATTGSWGRFVPICLRICGQVWLFLTFLAWLCFSPFSHFAPEVPRSPHPFFKFHLIIQVLFVPRYSRQSLHCLWSWSKTSGTRHWAGKLGAEVVMNS